MNGILWVVVGFVLGMFLYPRIMRWAYANNYIPSLPDMVMPKKPKEPTV